MAMIKSASSSVIHSGSSSSARSLSVSLNSEERRGATGGNSTGTALRDAPFRRGATFVTVDAVLCLFIRFQCSVNLPHLRLSHRPRLRTFVIPDQTAESHQ